MLKYSAFIEPAIPSLKHEPPTGPDWVHEVKFDGERAQLHMRRHGAVIYSTNGYDSTHRFRPIAACLLSLPVRSAIIDAEIVRCREDGMPYFHALMAGRSGTLSAYCFDLLALDGRDLRKWALMHRKALLKELISKAQNSFLRYSNEFDDPPRLLAAVEARRHEGIISRRRDGRYIGGTRCGWEKVKTASWRRRTGSASGCLSTRSPHHFTRSPAVPLTL